MGYRTDPLLSALSSYRVRGGPREGAVLAYLSNWSATHPARYRWGQNEYFPAAFRRAEAFGFRLEEFSLATPGMTPARLSDILKSRGIPGIIVQDSPYTTPVQLKGMDWEAFSWCAIGFSLRGTLLPRVAHDPCASMKTAWRGLWARGYRRIALWLEDWQDERVDYNWSDAYFGECRRSGVAPLFISFNREMLSPEDLTAQWHRQRPQVVITYGRSAPLQALFKSAVRGVEIPQWFLLNAGKAQSGFHGMDLHLDTVGAKAVDTVLSYLKRREYGPGCHPVVTQVPGSWKACKADDTFSPR